MEDYSFYPPRLFYPLTYVPKTYPEHHYPLENSRHRFAHAMHEYFIGPDSTTHSPRTDIRETQDKYYLDIELPGVSAVSNVELRWTNSRALAIQVNVARTRTSEEEAAASAGKDQSKAKDEKKDSLVHYLTMERQFGAYMRVFEFAADVDHESLKAKLHDGLLTMVIDKHPQENLKQKEIKIDKAQ